MTTTQTAEQLADNLEHGYPSKERRQAAAMLRKQHEEIASLRVLLNHEYSKKAPQPTTPEPVNQMLLTALKEFARVFPELNMSNFTDDDVADLNGWGIEVVTAIDAAEQAPQPTELTDEEIWDMYHDKVIKGHSITAFARAVLAAQKGKA